MLQSYALRRAHRPKSTAYIDSLLNHIELLQNRLEGVEKDAPAMDEEATSNAHQFQSAQGSHRVEEPQASLPQANVMPLVDDNYDISHIAPSSPDILHATMVGAPNISKRLCDSLRSN